MKVTIWVREEDKLLWEAIDNKSSWIHDRLNDIPPDPDEVAVEAMVDKILRKKQEEMYG